MNKFKNLTYTKTPSRIRLLIDYLRTRDNFYLFLLQNYGGWGITELEYKGIPIISEDSTGGNNG